MPRLKRHVSRRLRIHASPCLWQRPSSRASRNVRLSRSCAALAHLKVAMRCVGLPEGLYDGAA
eukprot:6203292-Pleurochrysis_carterae.AAC.1